MAFLDHPTRKAHGALVAAIERCHGVECAREVAPDTDLVRRLRDHVTHGQPLAVNIALRSLRLLDGGDLEDVARSLASVADSHPALFLAQIRQEPSAIP
jgi:hypothetical protein